MTEHALFSPTTGRLTVAGEIELGKETAKLRSEAVEDVRLKVARASLRIGDLRRRLKWLRKPPLRLALYCLAAALATLLAKVATPPGAFETHVGLAPRWCLLLLWAALMAPVWLLAAGWLQIAVARFVVRRQVRAVTALWRLKADAIYLPRNIAA